MSTEKMFTYVAVDTNGSRHTGVIRAITERAARDLLAKKGLLVEAVREGELQAPTKRSTLKGIFAWLFLRVSVETQQRFFAQLHSMYKSGVPLLQALETLERNQSSSHMKDAVRVMKEHVLQGQHLSRGMEQFPEIFTPMQVNLVRVGEQGGVLEMSLKYISEYLMKESQIRNKLKRATFPAKIVLVAVILLPFLANFAISALGREGGFRVHIYSLAEQPFFIPMLLGILGLIFFIVYGSRVPPIRLALHSLYLKIPYLGPTLYMYTMARFCRAFSALQRGGVPIAQVVELSADACGNDYIRNRITPSSAWIQEGKGITESLHRTGAFSDIAISMSATGEKSGNMEAMMDNVAEQYEDEASVRSKKMTDVLPVVLTVLAGLLVLYILVQFYSAYFGAIFSTD